MGGTLARHGAGEKPPVGAMPEAGGVQGWLGWGFPDWRERAPRGIVAQRQEGRMAFTRRAVLMGAGAALGVAGTRAFGPQAPVLDLSLIHI